MKVQDPIASTPSRRTKAAAPRGPSPVLLSFVGLVLIGSFFYWKTRPPQPNTQSSQTSSPTTTALSPARPSQLSALGDSTHAPDDLDAEDDSAVGDPDPTARPAGNAELPPVQSDRERDLPADHKAAQAERLVTLLTDRKSRTEEALRAAENRGDEEEVVRRKVILERLEKRIQMLRAEASKYRAEGDHNGAEDPVPPNAPAAQ